MQGLERHWPMGKKQIMPGLGHAPGTARQRPWTMRDKIQGLVHFLILVEGSSSLDATGMFVKRASKLALSSYRAGTWLAVCVLVVGTGW